jgi:hypothetical protein
MTYGYSQHTVLAVQSADTEKLGVLLGKACVANSVPVSVVAEWFKVSRQTVYNWFLGKHDPSEKLVGAIRTFIESLESLTRK